MPTLTALIFLVGLPYVFLLFGIERALRSTTRAQAIDAVVTGKWVGERSMALGVGGLGLSVLIYSYADESGNQREAKIYVTYPEWKQHEVSQRILLMKVPDPLFSTVTIYTKASFDSRSATLRRTLICF